MSMLIRYTVTECRFKYLIKAGSTLQVKQSFKVESVQYIHIYIYMLYIKGLHNPALRKAVGYDRYLFINEGSFQEG